MCTVRSQLINEPSVQKFECLKPHVQDASKVLCHKLNCVFKHGKGAKCTKNAENEVNTSRSSWERWCSGSRRSRSPGARSSKLVKWRKTARGRTCAGGAYLPGIKGQVLGGKVMGSKSSPAPGKPPPWGELPAIFGRSAKGAKMSENEPKLEKVNKSQLSGNEKFNKSELPRKSSKYRDKLTSSGENEKRSSKTEI